MTTSFFMKFMDISNSAVITRKQIMCFAIF